MAISEKMSEISDDIWDMFKKGESKEKIDIKKKLYGFCMKEYDKLYETFKQLSIIEDVFNGRTDKKS